MGAIFAGQHSLVISQLGLDKGLGGNSFYPKEIKKMLAFLMQSYLKL